MQAVRESTLCSCLEIKPVAGRLKLLSPATFGPGTTSSLMTGTSR
jgi:hypothetical protein